MQAQRFGDQAADRPFLRVLEDEEMEGWTSEMRVSDVPEGWVPRLAAYGFWFGAATMGLGLIAHAPTIACVAAGITAVGVATRHACYRLTRP